MKKIGVITFLTTKDNYGQVLQAFALQYILKQMGYMPFVINYKKNNCIWWKALLKAIIKLFYPNWHKTTSDIELDKKNKIRKFEDFISSNIALTQQKYQTLKQLKRNPPKADIYITGSDQVWAQLISEENNKAYFLDFGNKKTKRIAYAPSFAMENYPQNLIPQLTNLLKKFNAISVREKNGIDICRNAGRNDVKLVLDPTLLLNNDIYKKFFNINNNRKEYLFIYCINILTQEEMEWNALQQYAQRNKLDIIVTPSSGVYPARELFNNVTYDYSTIEDWLKNIAYSNLNITTSFHGIVFSIIFNKNFVYIPLRNAFSKANNRVFDLLDTLNLRCKILTSDKTLAEVANIQIKWDEVNKILENKRKESITFLEEAIR